MLCSYPCLGFQSDVFPPKYCMHLSSLPCFLHAPLTFRGYPQLFHAINGTKVFGLKKDVAWRGPPYTGHLELLCCNGLCMWQGTRHNKCI
jgi:hypothetical protein